MSRAPDVSSGVDAARGWTPDGNRVVFASTRDRGADTGVSAYFRLWTSRSTRSPAGRAPRAAPDAARVHRHVFARRQAHRVRGSLDRARRRVGEAQSSQWRHYRGGRTHPIRVMNLADYSVVKLPWTDSNDTTPMWVGNTVYFLSDRNVTTNLFATTRARSRSSSSPATTTSTS